MTGAAKDVIFSLELLQAVNNWQKSSSDKRGDVLRELSV